MTRQIAALLLLLLVALVPLPAAAEGPAPPPAEAEEPEAAPRPVVTDEKALAAVPPAATAEVRVGSLAFESLALRWAPEPSGTAEVAPMVEVGFLRPTAGADPKVLATLRRGMLLAAFEVAGVAPPADLDPESPARDLARLFATRRAMGEAEVAGLAADGVDIASTFAFSLTCEARLARGRFLSVLLHSYLYLPGAAHGSPYTMTRVFDLATGEVVPRERLVLDDDAAFRKVFPLIEKRIRADRGLGADAKLEEEGFFPESFALAGNVFLDDAGVGFYYNVYEIACYANGPDEVVVPFAEYPADALPADSPVRGFVKK